MLTPEKLAKMAYALHSFLRGDGLLPWEELPEDDKLEWRQLMSGASVDPTEPDEPFVMKGRAYCREDRARVCNILSRAYFYATKRTDQT